MYIPAIGGIQPGTGGSSSGSSASVPSVIHYGSTSVSKGSTNTLIARFPTQIESSGTDLTFTDSATLGSYVTVNTAGRYVVEFSIPVSAIPSSTGIKVNTSLNNTLTNSDTDLPRGYKYESYVTSHSVELNLEENDLVWIVSANTLAAFPHFMKFYMRGPL